MSQIPQILLGITLNPLFCSNFEWFSVVAISLWNLKKQKRLKSSNVAVSSTNLILTCCVIRLQSVKCTIGKMPRNRVSFSEIEQVCSCTPRQFVLLYRFSLSQFII